MVPPQPDSGSSGCAPATTTLSRCAVLPAFSPFACPASRGRPAAAATICDDRPSISRRVICFTRLLLPPCVAIKAARQYSPGEGRFRGQTGVSAAANEWAKERRSPIWQRSLVPRTYTFSFVRRGREPSGAGRRNNFLSSFTSQASSQPITYSTKVCSTLELSDCEGQGRRGIEGLSSAGQQEEKWTIRPNTNTRFKQFSQ